MQKGKGNLAWLEQLQYRESKLVSGALHSTSKGRLNKDLGWESIRKRIDFLGLPGVPKKSVPKIKVFYKKSRSGIISKPYCPNTLESSDMIL